MLVWPWADVEEGVGEDIYKAIVRGPASLLTAHVDTSRVQPFICVNFMKLRPFTVYDHDFD